MHYPSLRRQAKGIRKDEVEKQYKEKKKKKKSSHTGIYSQEKFHDSKTRNGKLSPVRIMKLLRTMDSTPPSMGTEHLCNAAF